MGRLNFLTASSPLNHPTGITPSLGELVKEWKKQEQNKHIEITIKNY